MNIKNIIAKHTPQQTKSVAPRRHAPWYKNTSLKELSQHFNIFFYDKINDIRTTLQADSDSRCQPASSQRDTLFVGKPLDKFSRVEVAEVVATLSQCANKSSLYLLGY